MITVNVTIADGSTPPTSEVSLTVSHVESGTSGPLGNHPMTSTHNFGIGTYTFGAHLGGVYLVPPPIGGGSCTGTQQNCTCGGNVNIPLWSLQGAFKVEVQKLPSRTFGPTLFYVEGPGGSAAVQTEVNGSWTTDVFPLNPNHEGVSVTGDGTGPGISAEYRFFTLDNNGRLFDEKRVKTESNKLMVVPLKAVDPWGSLPFLPPSLRTPVGGGGSGAGGREGDGAGGGPCSSVGFPVEVTTGNVFFDHVDAVIPGIGRGLALVRSYNSLSARVNLGGLFGRGWNTPFDMVLDEPASKVLRIRKADGVPLYYQDNNDDLTYVASMPLSERSTVVKSGSGYVRYLVSGAQEAYDTEGRVVSLTDPAGRVTTFARDGTGGLLSVTEPGGRSISFVRDGGGRIISASGPDGLIATYEYEAFALTSVTYPDGSGYRYDYDGLGQLLTVVDAGGRIVERHEYDAAGRGTVSERGPGIDKLTLSYVYGKTTVTDALGNVTVYDWQTIEGVDLVTTITGPCSSCSAGGDSQEWTYDAAGRVKTRKDGLGNVTTLDYDAAGNLISVTNALNQVTSHTHDSRGRVLTQTDPGGHVTTYVYNDAGPTSITETVTATQNRSMSISYNPQNLPASITDPRGKITDLTYDAYGQLIRIDDPLEHPSHFEYDSRGLLIESRDALEHSTTLTRDVRGRVTRVTAHDGTFTVITYDRSGLRETVRDALGRTRYMIRDDAGRVTASVDPLNGTTRYSYDVMSNLISLTDPKGQTTSFEYDGHSRVKKMTYPGGAFETFTYDAAGRLKTKTDRKNVTTTLSYDLLGRLLGKTYSNGEPAVSYTYHTAGTLATASNGTDTLTWTHDLARQLLSEQSSRNSSTAAYTYDAAGNRITVSLDGTLFVSYGYDDANRLTAITRGSNVFGFGYDNANRRTSMSLPNGVSTAYTYDNLNRLLRLKADKGAAPITDFQYTYDAVSNRASKTQLDYAEQYTYDALSRLTRIDRTGAGVGQQVFTYDAVGNRTANQTNGSIVQATFDDRNQLTSSSAGGPMLWQGSLNEPGNVTFTSATANGKPARMLAGNVFEAVLEMTAGTNTVTLEARDTTGNLTTKSYQVSVPAAGTNLTWDANGNLLTKTEGADSWSYTWDAENKLKRVDKNGAEVMAFQYDPLGRRVEKAAGVVVTTFAYDGLDILRHTVSDGATTTVTRYIHGSSIDEPLAQETVSSGVTQYYHADGLGSIVKLTDASGAVVLTRQYDAWGNPTLGAEQSGFAFTAREWDAETGLYYYRARYYDPKVGRFISEDPIGFTGGVNFYSYVSNAPVRFTDPWGLKQYVMVNMSASGGIGPVAGEFGTTYAVDVATGTTHVYTYAGLGGGIGAGLVSGVEVGMIDMNDPGDLAGFGVAAGGFVAAVEGAIVSIAGTPAWFGNEAGGVGVGGALGGGAGVSALITHTTLIGTIDPANLPEALRLALQKAYDKLPKSLQDKLNLNFCKR